MYALIEVHNGKSPLLLGHWKEFNGKEFFVIPTFQTQEQAVIYGQSKFPGIQPTITSLVTAVNFRISPNSTRVNDRENLFV